MTAIVALPRPSRSLFRGKSESSVISTASSSSSTSSSGRSSPKSPRFGALFRRLSSPSPAREPRSRDPKWGDFELKLSYRFGRQWSEQTGARFPGDIERGRSYTAAQSWLLELADELVTSPVAPWTRAAANTVLGPLDITSPDYGTSSSTSRTTRLALPADVGAALAHDPRDIARSALTQVRAREQLGPGSWPALQELLMLLQCLLPGMIWFQRTGVTSRDTYRPEPVDRKWMAANESRLRRILGNTRYDELLRAFEAQEQRDRAGSWRW